MGIKDLTVNLRVQRNRELITGWIDNKFTFTVDLRQIGLPPEHVKQLLERLDEKDSIEPQDQSNG